MLNPIEGDRRCSSHGVALEDTEHSVGEALHTMGGHIAHLLLYTDEVSGKQKVQDLATPVAQGLEPKGPSIKQRVKEAICLALPDQHLASAHAYLTLFQRLHQIKLISTVRKEQRQGSERALATQNFSHCVSFLLQADRGASHHVFVHTCQVTLRLDCRTFDAFHSIGKLATLSIFIR